MRITEITIACNCQKGTMYFSTLQDSNTGRAIMFLLTEDEKIYFRGLCDHCKREFDAEYPVMQLLFACKPDREVH